ncbi:hypothetical protein TRFO_33589 [Tritrichomonas foetus]|uniref:Uncharacterized protein n=1 Tax=Tritrichomonas foetus TaxID=1144522 RepID=A0A1J4JQQ0_9EUKA|nr:hypothetical protein TRFO_33589 [Tritrichomonas foetus]|eukprot:OHS99843.1 hypothetical protein TRFO_33589 [Tritrichomonas foetus]
MEKLNEKIIIHVFFVNIDSSRKEMCEEEDDSFPVLPPTYMSKTLSPRSSNRPKSERTSPIKSIVSRDFSQTVQSPPQSPRRPAQISGVGPSSPYRETPFSMKDYKDMLESEFGDCPTTARSLSQRSTTDSIIKPIKVSVPDKKPHKYRPLPEVEQAYLSRIPVYSKTSRDFFNGLTDKYTKQYSNNPLGDDLIEHRLRSIERAKLMRECYAREDQRLRKIENREHKKALRVSYSRDVFHGDELTHPHYPSLRMVPTWFRQTQNYNRKAFI